MLVKWATDYYPDYVHFLAGDTNRIHDMLIISFGIPFAGESYRDLYPILSPYPIYRRL